jgi:predicted metal-dependent hydrolase
MIYFISKRLLLNCKITHKQTEISYTLVLSNRRSTTIQVHRDRSVRVLAPRHSSKRSIEKIVSERADWILKKQKQFSAMPSCSMKELEFTTGESLFFLGNDYPLQIATGRTGVELINGNLCLSAPKSSSREQRRKILQKWYRQQSEQIFAERILLCMQTVKQIGIKKAPEWKARVLKRSWGSCSGKGRLNLNIELVSAPLPCIDYVILHELCHLKEHNHSPRFYKLIDKVCPDWKLLRKELNDNYQSRLV